MAARHGASSGDEWVDLGKDGTAPIPQRDAGGPQFGAAAPEQDFGSPRGYPAPYAQQPGGSPYDAPAQQFNAAPPPPYGQGQPWQMYGQPTVAPKSPGVALLASFFVPGLGSMMNGDVGKGIGILLGYVVSWVLVVFLIGFIGVIGFWIWGLVDAYQGAQRWNAAHGIIS